ncbi:UvrD-helicase domain-containing protein [Clostridium beijerinckii]|uniref:UvrD-helicase domain-containing protein n=1 Tax=Clostridium beijerinckii TaxID=1520 RepID=UPI00233057F5|nr:UvrD-helicase domain-containing protein [Clostridium beijerinckii]
MDCGLTPLDKVKECIKNDASFVLQGGAGSGKTESLKQLLNFLSEEYPEKKVVCITHTNLAVNEIKSRVGEHYVISTIHSFLHSLIKDYKKNIRDIILETFKILPMEDSTESLYESESQYKKQKYENYKRAYQKYSDKMFIISGIIPEKIVGKREYDLNSSLYNDKLNIQISDLNLEISKRVYSKDYNCIIYNETKFDSLNELSYGHDSLLNIAYLLFKKYPTIGKILQDKYDLILIDEYQDTDEKVMSIFLDCLPTQNKTIIGLFGDSMQSIYSNGIGSSEKYISSGKLENIQKEDNYRCSEQVINFINKLRNDGIIQKVALKIDEFKRSETLEERQGVAKLLYGIVECKPSSRSSLDEKKMYLSTLDFLIEKAEESIKGNYKILLLTNKSIASKAGFQNLYEIFDKRYSEVAEHIENHLAALQLIDLLELCDLYESREYNEIIRRLKKSGFNIGNVNDKKKLKECFEKIVSSNMSLIETIELAFKMKILKKSERYENYIANKDKFLSSIRTKEYLELENLYTSGNNTFVRMKKEKTDLTEDVFKNFQQSFKKEMFFNELFSNKIDFQEIRAYYQYINERTTYITMHKTKGSGIDNVIVVLEEYFWNEYDFTSLIQSDAIANQEKRIRSLNLTYVACSRARSNLICIKLISKDEEIHWKNLFPDNEKIDISI